MPPTLHESGSVELNDIQTFGWPTMWAFLMTRGTQRLTKLQYTSVR